MPVMTKEASAATLSPLAISSGALALASHGRTVASASNYVAGRRPQQHLSVGPSVLVGVEVPAVGLSWPTSGTTTMIVARVYIQADVVTLTIGVEASIAGGATTLRTTVRVGGAAGVNIDATSANNGAEQTTTVATSSTGTGWQTVEVDLTRVSGVATGFVRYLSIQDTPITDPTTLPDPPNS